MQFIYPSIHLSIVQEGRKKRKEKKTIQEKKTKTCKNLQRERGIKYDRVKSASYK